MKRNFPLQSPGKADARVLDAIKHEVRKYVRREHRKPLPEGFNRLEFFCKVGAAAESASDVPLEDISSAIDAAAREGGATIYIEVLAAPAQRISTRPRLR